MIVQHPCPDCGGSGQFCVTTDMAIDAGDRRMDGMLIPCRHCHGDGFILEEVGDEVT